MYKRDKLFMVVLIGPPGAGKTTLALFLKDQLINTAHVALDNIKRFISQFREVDSHNMVSRNVATVMADEYLKNNICVIVDQNMETDEVERYKQVAEKHGADCFVYRIHAHKDIRNERISERTARENKPMMSAETFTMLSQRYEKNSHPSNATFDSDTLTTEEMANCILKDLKVI